MKKIRAGKIVGKMLAKRAKDKVCIRRIRPRGFKYSGRVKALADGAAKAAWNSRPDWRTL